MTSWLYYNDTDITPQVMKSLDNEQRELYTNIIHMYDPDYSISAADSTQELFNACMRFTTKPLPGTKKAKDSFRHYAITLTTISSTRDELVQRIEKLFSSKQCAPIEFKYCLEHEDSNIHAHIYLKTSKYIKSRFVYTTNNEERCDVKLLKGLAIPKWLNYLAKESDVISL